MNALKRLLLSLIGMFLAFFPGAGGATEKDVYEPFRDLIVESALTKRGPITVHKVKDKIFFEFPESAIGRDWLVALNGSGGGVVRWVINGNEIQLVAQPVTTQTGTIIPVEELAPESLKPYLSQTVLWRFPILAIGPVGPVIDVSEMIYQLDKLGLVQRHVGTRLGANWSSRPDLERTWVESIHVGTNSLEIEITQTVEGNSDRVLPLTFRSHLSIVLLPNTPMRPRLHDPRIGYWTENLTGIGADYSNSTRSAILRWRLEKAYPEKKISEPIQPIVFYLDPAMPTQWKKYVKQGVEAWQAPFESAGFKNAIVVKEFTSDQMGVSMHDSRHSVVRWLESQERYNRNLRDDGKGGGTARYLIDQRSGEIIRAEIIISQPYELLRDRYFVRAAPLDERAKKLPFPDDLMGELLQSLVSHETGHALGLRDGNYGEFVYSTDDLRSQKWLEKNGHTPSIMNYTRANNIPQPDDGVLPSGLIQRVGPADSYSIHWGYASIPNASTPDDELQMLDKWARKQDASPWLRYVRGGLSLGPQDSSEVVESNDPVKSTMLALTNLRRVMDLVPTATLEAGSDNALLEHMYFRILDHWASQMNYVGSMIGGVTVQYKSGSQIGDVYSPIAADRQREALTYLAENAFQPPLWLVRTDITRRFEASGAVSNIVVHQENVLRNLLDSRRLKRLAEQSIVDREKNVEVYALDEMVLDLRVAVWSELQSPSVVIDGFRQELQLAFTRKIGELVMVGDRQELGVYERSVLLNELDTLRADIDKSMRKAKDGSTRGHLIGIRNQLNDLLD